MTFAEAATAYELLQSGCTYRFVAKQFGLSNTHLGRIIKQYLELGEDAPLLNVEQRGRPRTVPIAALKKAHKLRINDKLSWWAIGQRLGVYSEPLRRAHYHAVKAGLL